MHRRWLWVLQGGLALGVAVFVGRSLARHWGEFRSIELELQLDVRLLVVAAVAVCAAYAILIEAWRRVVIGWGQTLRFRSAAQIWCLSNMGRYLPGKVWSFAGLAVLSQRAGVSGWTATGSAFAMQALALGTGASVIAVAVPGALSSLQLVVAAAVAATIVWLLVSGSPLRKLVHALRPGVEWKALPVGVALVAGGATLVAWVAYGSAFWLLAHGILPDVQLPLRVAVGVFAAGYLVGLLALFAPGGLGVRELIFVAILAPRVGSGGAVALAVGSRLLLTITEVGVALAALAASIQEKERVVDASE